MATFKIEGGHLLSGTITPQGAKNEALQVICATLLTHEPVTISNIPNIRDVNNLIQLLKDVGVKVTSTSKGVFTFQADALNMAFLESDEFVEKCAFRHDDWSAAGSHGQGCHCQTRWRQDRPSSS